MSTAKLGRGIFSDITMMGVRVAVGTVFIVHGMGKFNPGFAFALDNWGIPAAMQVPIALAEVVPGILLIIGILTRISSGLLAIVMLGAIFLVKGAQAFAGDGPTTEFDIVLMAAALLVAMMGPGRISLVRVISKIPRFLH